MDSRFVNWVQRGAAVQATGLAIALGLAFFLSNDRRLSADSYWGVVQTGGSAVWGVVFLLVGCTIASSTWKGWPAMRVSFRLAAVAYMLLAVAFGLAVFRYETANLTAPVVYGWLAFTHAAFAAMLTRMHR